MPVHQLNNKVNRTVDAQFIAVTLQVLGYPHPVPALPPAPPCVYVDSYSDSAWVGAWCGDSTALPDNRALYL